MNPATTVSVAGAFTTHGTGRGGSSSTSNHFEFQNYTSIQLAKNFVRLGGRLRTDQGTNVASGDSGMYSLELHLFIMDPRTDYAMCRTDTKANIAALRLHYGPVRRRIQLVMSGLPPPTSAGVPYRFSADHDQQCAEYQRARKRRRLTSEDDWKVKEWDQSVGRQRRLRLEAQNFIHSSYDLAPRASVAYGIPRKERKAH